MSEADDPKRNDAAEGERPAPSAEPARDEPDEGAPTSDRGLAEVLRANPPKPSDEGAEMFDEVELRELMRQALDRPPEGEPPDLLKGVQRRIRTRSRGKFYNDGWSTARAPRSTYLMTSLLMLILIAFVFLVLIPWGGGALPLP